MIKSLSSSLRLFLFFSILSAELLGCAKSQLPNVPLTNIATYNTYQSRNGLSAAVDIFYEKDRLLHFFGADLLYYGILPIYVIVENNDSHPFIVEERNFILLGNSKAILRESPTHASNEILQEQQEIRRALLVTRAIAPCLWPVTVPAGFHTEDLDIVRNNLYAKQLLSNTIYKGDFNRGFLYFPLKQIIAEDDNIVLEAKFKKLSTEDIYILKFNIDTKEIKKTADKLKELRRSTK